MPAYLPYLLSPTSELQVASICMHKTRNSIFIKIITSIGEYACKLKTYFLNTCSIFSPFRCIMAFYVIHQPPIGSRLGLSTRTSLALPLSTPAYLLNRILLHPAFLIVITQLTLTSPHYHNQSLFLGFPIITTFPYLSSLPLH